MKPMSLDEEIAIHQFGQNVRTEVDMLAQFAQLGEEKRQWHSVELGFLISQLKLVDADIEQALAASSLGVGYTPPVMLKFHRICINRRGNKPEEDYRFMLHLFKAAYQRRFAEGNHNPTNWWYWDLSQAGIEQSIWSAHHQLVNELYNNSGFRSEFTSLAKLHREGELKQSKSPELPAPVSQYHFDFVTYDELMTESIKLLFDKTKYSVMIVRHSLEKALSTKYGLETAQVRRIVSDVVERHMREKYGTGLSEQP